MKTVFQIHKNDNVVTALCELCAETAVILGESTDQEITVSENIPKGHKVSVKDIAVGEDIVKYGVVIGRAMMDIKKGQWVHLHNIQSIYDERSSHLDIHTGAPTDIKYE